LAIDRKDKNYQKTICHKLRYLEQRVREAKRKGNSNSRCTINLSPSAVELS